jgi:hypothetical protein
MASLTWFLGLCLEVGDVERRGWRGEGHGAVRARFYVELDEGGSEDREGERQTTERTSV